MKNFKRSGNMVEEVGGIFNAEEIKQKTNWFSVIKIWLIFLLLIFSIVYTIRLALTL